MPVFLAIFLSRNSSLIKSQNLLENPLLFPTEITNFLLEPNSRKAEILYIIQCDVGASKNAEQAFSTKRLSSHCIIYKISAFRLFSSTNQYLFKIFYSAFKYLLILFCVDILCDIFSDTFGMCHLTKDTTIWTGNTLNSIIRTIWIETVIHCRFAI